MVRVTSWMMMAVACFTIMTGCGKDLGRVTLVGTELPKALENVSVGREVTLDQQIAQTATYPGAKMDDYKAHISKLQRDGWSKVNESDTVASMMAIMKKGEYQAKLSWGPSSGLMVQVLTAKKATPPAATKAPNP